MNGYLVAASVLTGLMCLAHSVLGEIFILIPLHRREGRSGRSGLTTREVLRFTWHILSVLGLGMAVILWYYARFTALSSDQIAVLRILALTCLVSFGIALAGSRARHPSWAVFLAVAGLTWLSAR
jgi:hypothetical protein